MLDTVWIEGKLRGIAAGQHGLLRRSQALSLGVTDHEIGWRLATDRIEQPHPGVYYLNSTLATWRTEVLAAVMAAGPQALASHRCAAVLWEIDAIYGRMIEVTVPYSESPEPTGVLLHRSQRPIRVLLDAIPITTLREDDPRHRVSGRNTHSEKAARSAIRRGITTQISWIARWRCWEGEESRTRRFRTAVRLVVADRSSSVAEIDMKHIVVDAPVPVPVQQLRIRLRDGSNAYPDFTWPDRMRIVEVDGFEAHGTPEDLQRDLWRQNQLMELGWEIRRFTATDVRDRPDQVRAEIVHFVNQPFREG
jgi:hypothetical protein